MSRKECRWFFPKILDVLKNGVAKNIAKIGTNFESRTKNRVKCHDKSTRIF